MFSPLGEHAQGCVGPESVAETLKKKKKLNCKEWHTHPSAGETQKMTLLLGICIRTTVHTRRHGVVLQSMQLSNFYCNWKTIHHRNFMVGLGKSVIYNKWWNSLSLAIWLHMKNAKCKYGSLQSNTIRSPKLGWSCLPPCRSFSNTNTAERHFLYPLWFSLSIHDIGSFIQKIQKKKLAFEKLLL